MALAVGQRRNDDIVVFEVRRPEGRCDGCREKLGPGRWIRLLARPSGSRRALCMRCAGLDHLIQLPTGDPSLTRRAKKYSNVHGVIVRWARARKRYERVGWLVEEAAISKATAELEQEGKAPSWRLAGELWFRAHDREACRGLRPPRASSANT